MPLPSILIIDDNREIARIFASILQRESYRTDVVFDGETAVSHLSESVPDLIILDMNLPNQITGEDILTKVRQDVRFADTRIVVVTGFPQAARFLPVKPDTVLCKPVHLEQIRHIVARYCPVSPAALV